jgi:hypothetical protein
MLCGRVFASTVAFAAALGGISRPAGAIPGASQVQIEVTGNVVAACSNNSTVQQVDVGDLNKSGTLSVTFAVDCNTPFRYTMQSLHGALRLSNASPNAPAESVQVPYNVQVHIPLTLGGAIDDSCDSTSIRQGVTTCTFTDSGQKVAIGQQATTKVSWNGAQGRAMAGNYTDQLTFFITAKL